MALTNFYFSRMNEINNPWKIRSKKRIYENQWIRLHEYKVINPNGGAGIYGKVSFRNYAVGILPIDEEQNTWLVGQYRFTLDAYSWEIPMGGVPRESDLRKGAMRELKEETGLIARRMRLLMRVHTSNSVTDEEGFIFVASNLKQGKPDFDDTEDLQIKKLPFSEALQMVLKGGITDSLSVAAILKYAHQLGA